MKKYKYRIGTCVTFNGVYFSERNKNKKKFKRVEKEGVGQIVGATKRFEGKIVTDQLKYINGYEPPEPVPPYLEISNTRFFYLVREGFVNKELLVAEEDIEQMPLEKELFFTLPYFKITPYPWSEQERERMREDATCWKRDEKGRWAK